MAGVADNNSNLGPFYHASYPTLTSVEEVLDEVATQAAALSTLTTPVEVDPESVTLAEDLHAALVTLGLVVAPA